MSKGYNANETYVDTGLLRDHVSKLREEKKLAMRLRDGIVAMRNNSDSAAFGEFYPILRDLDMMIEYFERMARVLAVTESEAVQLSRELGNEIEENTAQTQHRSSSSFML